MLPVSDRKRAKPRLLRMRKGDNEDLKIAESTVTVPCNLFQT